NMSGDPEQEYFADGIVEEIITALSRFRQLFVIARNSTFTEGRSVDVKQVGRELGVRYVLEGSVRRSADRVRVTGQLIDAATGAHLWADRFDGALELNAGAAFIDRALVLNPNLAAAWYYSGFVRVWLGQPDTAIDHIARAMRLSPLDPITRSFRNATAHAHFCAGRYDQASLWAEMVLQ